MSGVIYCLWCMSSHPGCQQQATFAHSAMYKLQTFSFTQQPSSATGQMSHDGTSFLDSSRLCSVCDDPLLPNGNTQTSKIPVCPSCAHQIMKVQAGGPDPSDFLPPVMMARHSVRQADFFDASVTG